MQNATAQTIQERYANRVKARLDRPLITVAEARDGILDCFIATYFQGVAMGLKSLVAVEGGDDEVARVTAAMFRRRMREHGASFDAPTIDALLAVKDDVDRELHVTELPAEIRGVHDQVCSLLLAKADGSLAHQPGRSAVAPAASATTAAAAAPRPLPSPPPPPSNAAAGLGDELRRVLARHLQQVAKDVVAGAAPDAVRAALARTETLLAAVVAFDG